MRFSGEIQSQQWQSSLKNFPCEQTNEEKVLFTYLVLARTPGMQVAGIGHYPNAGAMD